MCCTQCTDQKGNISTALNFEKKKKKKKEKRILPLGPIGLLTEETLLSKP